jgi:polysaccharide export outer membrane protein
MTNRLYRLFLAALSGVMIVACSDMPELPAARPNESAESPMYRIGPGDQLQIFVWRQADLTTAVPVRPDGRISIPLIEDLPVAGKTPSETGRDIEGKLATYVQDPLVTVIVGGFSGTFDEQVRVVGAAQQPQAIPFRANMTLLDVMISVGGLTQFASGNRATLVRMDQNQQREYRLRIDDLLGGDIKANVALLPGDIIIIPQTYF